MGLKTHSRSKAIHIMLVYTGGCNGCDIEIVNSVLSPRFDLEQYGVFLTWNPREDMVEDKYAALKAPDKLDDDAVEDESGEDADSAEGNADETATENLDSGVESND